MSLTFGYFVFCLFTSFLVYLFLELLLQTGFVYFEVHLQCMKHLLPCSSSYSLIKDLLFFLDSWRHESCFVPTFFCAWRAGAGWNVLWARKRLMTEALSSSGVSCWSPAGLPTPGTSHWGPGEPWTGFFLGGPLGGALTSAASELVGEG